MSHIPKRKTIRRKLDKLVGELIRAKGRCEAAGTYNTRCAGRLEWCHIHSRRYLAVRWDVDNALCLCSSHHRYFTNNPLHFSEFLLEFFPSKMERLREKFRTVTSIKTSELVELHKYLTSTSQ